MTDNELKTWAENNLSNEELSQFMTDREENLKRYNDLLAQGLILQNPIYENKFSTILNSVIAVQIGIEISGDPFYATDGNSMTLEYFKWYQRCIESNFTSS